MEIPPWEGRVLSRKWLATAAHFLLYSLCEIFKMIVFFISIHVYRIQLKNAMATMTKFDIPFIEHSLSFFIREGV